MPSGEYLDLLFDGQPFRIGRPGLEIYFDAAERVGALRGHWFEEALRRSASLQGEPLRSALAMAFERHQRVVTDRDISEWLDSPEGAVFILHHALQLFQPEIQEHEAHRIYESLDGEQLTRLAWFFAEGLRCLAHPRPEVNDERIEAAL